MTNKMILQVPDVCDASILVCKIFEEKGISKDLGTIACLMLVLRVLNERGNTLEEAREYLEMNIQPIWKLLPAPGVEGVWIQ